MTKSQFQEALLRGQGRCIKACQKDPDRYFSIVLWACGHEVAFDTQCEGSRSWFVYQLICCYRDQTVFRKEIIASLQKGKSNGSWKILYLAELLYGFVLEGDKTAEAALWSKYQEIYSSLQKRKRSSMKFCRERDDFEKLCLILANDKASMLKIAEDIGSLYREKAFLDGWDFEWLYDSKAKQYMKSLIKRAEISGNVAEFLRAGKANEEREKNSPISLGNRSQRSISMLLKRNGDKETIQKYAVAYIEAEDPIERAEALEIFSRCPYPNNPEPILIDAESECSRLSEVAWQALENIEHPLVREFAKRKIQTDVENALPLLIVNYEEEDCEELIRLVEAIPIDFACSTMWHSIHLDLLGMKDHGKKVPADLLYYIVENTYCSCCREYALRQLGKRKLLTTEILEESLYDSNEEIRKYAKRKLEGGK